MGFGIGLICLGLMSIIYFEASNYGMSKEEIIKKARDYGMVLKSENKENK